MSFSIAYELSTSWESSILNSGIARIYLHLEPVSENSARSLNFLTARDTFADFVSQHITSEVIGFPTDYAGLVFSVWADLVPSYLFPATHFLEAGHILEDDCIPFLCVPLNLECTNPLGCGGAPEIFNRIKSTFELLPIPCSLPLLPEVCHSYTLIIFEALFLAVIHDRGLAEDLVTASSKPIFSLDRLLGD